VFAAHSLRAFAIEREPCGRFWKDGAASLSSCAHAIPARSESSSAHRNRRRLSAALALDARRERFLERPWTPHASRRPDSMNETRRASEVPLPGGSFRLFATRLSFQAMISLGLIENPLTKTRTKNLANAQMLLDDLVMLRAKTAGNLDADEDDHLEKIISDVEYALERENPAEIE
jgi:hypothetical protein